VAHGGDERILKLLRGPALGDLPHAPDGPHAGVPHALRLRRTLEDAAIGTVQDGWPVGICGSGQDLR
jgi:hypothetical protein